MQQCPEDAEGVLGTAVGLVETPDEHLLSITRGDLQSVDDEAPILAEQRTRSVDSLGGDLSRGALEAVFEPRQGLALALDLPTHLAMCDLDAADCRAPALSVVVQGTAELGFEGLDLLSEHPDFLFEGLVSGVRDEPILCLGIGAVLDDLVDGVVLAEVLEVVFLAPAQTQAVDDLRRLHRGR